MSVLELLNTENYETAMRHRLVLRQRPAALLSRRRKDQTPAEWKTTKTVEDMYCFAWSFATNCARLLSQSPAGSNSSFRIPGRGAFSAPAASIIVEHRLVFPQYTACFGLPYMFLMSKSVKLGPVLTKKLKITRKYYILISAQDERNV